MHRLRLALATAGLLTAGGLTQAHAAPPPYSGVQTIQYYGDYYGCGWRCREWRHRRWEERRREEWWRHEEWRRAHGY